MNKTGVTKKTTSNDTFWQNRNKEKKEIKISFHNSFFAKRNERKFKRVYKFWARFVNKFLFTYHPRMDGILRHSNPITLVSTVAMNTESIGILEALGGQNNRNLY